MPGNPLDRFGLDRTPAAAWIGSQATKGKGAQLSVRSPIDGSTVASLPQATGDDVEAAARAAGEAFRDWRLVPAPKRGEFVRRLGNALRDQKVQLAELVTDCRYDHQVRKRGLSDHSLLLVDLRAGSGATVRTHPGA